MINIFTAPNLIETNNKKSIFLAGTIEMGKSIDWQSQAINSLQVKFRSQYTVNIFNPRRPEWDRGWEQKFSNPHFHQQVSWEMDALDRCDLIIMHLDGKSKSPISLMELGMYAKSGKIKVSCEPDYYRRGNVEMLCNKYRIPLFKSLNDLLQTIPCVL